MPFSSADPNALVAIGMQTALGTPQATAAKFRFARFLSGTNAGPDEQSQMVREGGDGLDVGLVYKTAQKAAGQLVVNARPEILGALLAAVPGGATFSGASAPAVHTFHTSHASHPWYTLLMQHPGSAIPQLYSDIHFSGLTIAGQGGQPWKVTAPFTAITHGASFAAVTPTAYGDDPFYMYSNPTYVLDGVGDSDITGFQIAIALTLDEQVQSQALSLDELPVLKRDITVQITRRFENPYQWQHIYYGASSNIAPTTAVATGSFRADSLYGSSGNLRSISLNVPLIAYQGDTLTELDPDGKTVYETITGVALKGGAGGTSAFYAVLNNAHASAYVG